MPFFRGDIQDQVLDDGNSKVITSAESSPGMPWVGAWAVTRQNNYLRQLVIVSSGVPAGLGGTFTFEFGEDGVTALISEARVIGSFATLRDFDLLNAGAYFRVKFEPDRVLVGAESVIITTTQRRTFDGSFVRLLTQQLEENTAAMPDVASFLKALDASGLSQNLRATVAGELKVSGPLTNGELRATPVQVEDTVASSTLGSILTALASLATQTTLAATKTVLDLVKAKTDNLDVLLSSRLKPGDAVEVSNFPATQPISTVSLPLPIGAATETTLAARFAAVPPPTSPSFMAVSALGDNTLYTPASGKRIRLKWLGLATSQNNTVEVVAILKIGSTQLRGWPLGNPGAFANGFVHEGAVDEVLKLNLSIAGQPVYANWSLEEF